jgi:hypothetical protein
VLHGGRAALTAAARFWPTPAAKEAEYLFGPSEYLLAYVYICSTPVNIYSHIFVRLE